METVTVENLPPVWTFYVIAIAQLAFGIATLAIAAALIAMIGKITKTLADVNDMTRELNRKMPSLLDSVDGTMLNVKAISDDARETTTNVTGTVNRVSSVVGSVTGKLESPLVKGIGVLTGVAAGINSMRGNKAEASVKVKKKKGFFGRGK